MADTVPEPEGLDRPQYPPIADYGFLSDCEVTALVAPSGNVEWMCVPRMDSPSVFGAVLGRSAGSFRVGPAEVNVPSARRYLPGTMVLETSWKTATGWVIVRDVLLIGPWHHTDEINETQQRPPTDYEAEHVLLRTIRCASGEAQVVMDCEPVFEYGECPGTWERTGKGYHQGKVTSPDGSVSLLLTTDMRLGFEGGRASARTFMREGEQRFVALSWSEHPPPETFDNAYRRLVWTAHHWQHWLNRGHFPDHRWRSHLERSALTLRGLTYAPSGALIAAATTSLPETPGGERNYDYRYTWIRDSTFALWGLYSLGFDWEAVDFYSFIADVAGQAGELKVMYAIDGSPVPDERTLDHLPGYEGARPVRVGNAAKDQRQHDVWGAVLDSVYIHAKSRERLDGRVWPILRQQVEAAIENWREPDRGIWEVRGEPQHFTSSKLMCWVALDRGAKLARTFGEEALATQWAEEAQTIHKDICANGVDSRGVFTQRYGDDALDASLLLVPLFGFLPPTDPRVVATVEAIERELTEGGLVLRYRVEETDDGFSGKEGTFTICSFWLVSALVEIGEVDRAKRLCERLLSYAGALELYAEELEPQTGEQLGNFPQAFTHLALINAVMHLIEAGA